jgi:hypothetical protein
MNVIVGAPLACAPAVSDIFLIGKRNYESREFCE